MLKRIEKGLHQALAIAESKTAPQNLQKALHHSIFPGGARIRPQLCLAVATACGDDDPALSTAAASAIELLHCASLVHDDLPCFDNALVRRGQASVHAAFGERLAVLAGDALAGADADTWKPLGEWLGEAYQVADDIRDVLADQAMMGKPQGQDITHDRPSSARDLGLVGAVQHFDELVYKAINSIPSCKGEKMLRGLVAKEAERLIPESWFANTNRPLHHHATV